MNHNNIIPFNADVYFDDTLVKATQTLTSDATNPDNNGTITIDTVEYTLKSTLTAAVAASATLTSDQTQPAAGDTVTIGTVVYTFVEELSATHLRNRVPNEVLIGADADETLQNLVDAINGDETALGTTYSLGTVAHPLVSAADVDTHATVVTARTAGADGNEIAKAEDSDHLDWDGTGETFTSGVSTVPNEIKIGANAATTLDNIKKAINGTGTPGTEYSVGTVAHPTVEATTNADTTQVVQARTGGVAGNTIASTDNATHLSWGATALAGGGGTVGIATINNGGGLIHQITTNCPQLTGTPTYTVTIKNAEGDILYVTGNLNENAVTHTAKEIMLGDGDQIILTASGTVEDTLPVVLNIR